MLFPRPSIPDAELVRAVLHGRTRQFGVLVERYQGLVYSTLLARVSRIEEVEDLAQETFLRAFRQLDSLQDPRAFRGWLKQIADHLALNFLRSRKLQRSAAESLIPLPTAGTPPPDQLFERQEIQTQVWSAISQLAEEQREVILLYYYQDRCSVEQLAEWLELPPSTVRGRLERARRELKELLSSDAEVERAIQPHRPGKAFKRKIMSVLPLVPWNLRQPPNTLSQMGWALGTVLTGVVGFMVFGLAQGWWPERQDPAIAVQWVRSQESGPEVDPSAIAPQAGLVGWVNGIDGGGDQPSLFGGQGLSPEAQALQDQALVHGWGGRLAWEFEEGEGGWRAREGSFSHRPPDLLPTKASNGVLRIDLGPYQPGRVPAIELISPEIGYDSRLFERVEVRARVIHPTAAPGRLSMAWTNPLNRLFPGRDPRVWERRTDEERQAEAKHPQHIPYIPFAIWDLPPVDFSSGWRDIVITGLGERAQARWEGNLVDLRLGFMLAEFRNAAEITAEQFPQALEIDRIVLSHAKKPINQTLTLPEEPAPNAVGQWLGAGSFYPVTQQGLQWPLLGDLDGDGDLDLVLTYQAHDQEYNTQQGVVTAFNDGKGRFALGRKQVLEYRRTGGYNSIMHLAGADLDQDGLFDIVLGTGVHTQLLLNQGEGVFREDKTWEDQIYVGRGDVDKDVDVDVVTMPYRAAGYTLPRQDLEWPASLYLNYGQGIFVEQALEPPTPGKGWFPHALEDFDGDGQAELVWQWMAEKGLEAQAQVWTGYAVGKWQKQLQIPFQQLPATRKYYLLTSLGYLGNLRGEGTWELGTPLEAYAETNTLLAGMQLASAASGTIPTTWLPREVHLRPSFEHQPQIIPQIWDLDRDGVFDPLFVDVNYRAGACLLVMRGQQGQLPVEEGRYSLPGTPSGWAAGDVDGDGDVDVVVLAEGLEGSGVYVFQNHATEQVAGK
ncbi:MAG: sigma-70 family RNA polymerase sigma factor [Candidatus Latescibacteria bacterium]|nr:sigma-70 family RNA polymerase sigma factor [Candidatus Latescibacterota bacterium]